MKRLFVFLFVVNCLNTTAQIRNNEVLLSNKNWDFVYRNYENPFEILACSTCDSVTITADAATITVLDQTAFTVMPDKGAREVSIKISCFENGVSNILYREKFSVKLLPNPNVYLGGIDLRTDLDRTTDEVLYNNEKFTARYDQNTPLKGVQFKLKYWSISIGRKTYFGANNLLTAEWRKAFIKARRKTAITFNYCIVVGPDGYKRKIVWNMTYAKQSKRNHPQDKAGKSRYTNPQEGG